MWLWSNYDSLTQYFSDYFHFDKFGMNVKIVDAIGRKIILTGEGNLLYIQNPQCVLFTYNWSADYYFNL